MADDLCLYASDRGGYDSGGIPLRRGQGLGVFTGAIERSERDTRFVFGCVAAGWASFGIWFYYF
jgi:hypothetical protein